MLSYTALHTNRPAHFVILRSHKLGPHGFQPEKSAVCLIGRGRLLRVHAAATALKAHRASSPVNAIIRGTLRGFRRGKDFEEEKSLDMRRRGPGCCSRDGRLWRHQLFCGPGSAPSGLTNRVLIAIQNPSIAPGARSRSWMPTTTSAAASTESLPRFPSPVIPLRAHHHPEHGRGDLWRRLRFRRRSMDIINYATEGTTGATSGLNGLSASIFVTRSQSTSLPPTRDTTCLQWLTTPTAIVSAQPSRRVPHQRKPGGSVALAFVQNSNYVYYPRKLSGAQGLAYSGGLPPGRGRSGLRTAEFARLVPIPGAKPDHVDATGNYYGAPLVFDRPVKAVFSADGNRVRAQLRSGVRRFQGLHHAAPHCSDIFLLGQQSGTLPPTAY